mgnify:CR=1 FL=1
MPEPLGGVGHTMGGIDAVEELDGEAGRFTIGPLSEVAAVHHTWAELAPHLAAVPVATFVAHERAIRGETIDPASLADLPPVLDIPAGLRAWEPDYPCSTCGAGIEFVERSERGFAGTLQLNPLAGAPIWLDGTDVNGDGTVDWAIRPSTPFNPGQIAIEELTVTEGQIELRHAAVRLIESQRQERFAAAPHPDFQVFGQSVDHRYAHTVQATGKLVILIGELTAGVQTCEDNFDTGNTLVGVNINRHAAAVVLDRQGTVLENRDLVDRQP